MDVNLAGRIKAGELAGPAIDATAPYLNGANTFLQMHTVKTAEDARRHIAYWSDQGATSVKAYMQISREALKAGIDEAHRRRMKVTGHLCSVTYREAADLGIDNLEHGFFASTDFVADKQPDRLSGPGPGPAVRGGRRRERRGLQGARRYARGEACGADLDADGVRDVDPRPAERHRVSRS